MKEEKINRDNSQTSFNSLALNIQRTEVFVKTRKNVAKLEAGLEELLERRKKIKDCAVRDNIKLRGQEVERYDNSHAIVIAKHDSLVKTI